ncbi:alpha/beta hydrolase family protein (plasmid) [Nitrobacteraceae bacterium UC4449_H16]
MDQSATLTTAGTEKPIELQCRDGITLRGHLWQSDAYDSAGTIIINPATGVQARYYHRFARFLTEHGFRVLTYDYRGIGKSRLRPLKGCGFRWRDWGEQDFDAALRFALAQADAGPLQVVGHSIGGFLPGFSPAAPNIARMLTVGGQYAYWRDYSELQRTKLFWKWHVAMPALTFALGYFPGKRLGWLEDLPAGVAYEWSFRGRRMERSYPASERGDILSRFGSVNAAILAVGVSDDPIASLQAIDRTLGYYSSAPKARILITPFDLGMEEVGHFGLFHDRHRSGFWQQSLGWLCDGRNPWSFAEIPSLKALKALETSYFGRHER